ncbi:MAG: mechanosensitive ion channel domain-containing protein [Polyangiaceae bacterium]
MHLHDRDVFTIRAPLGSSSIEARAKQAEKALEVIHFEHGQNVPDTHIDAAGETRVVYIGTSPIVTVGPDDAKAAGDPTVDIAAEKIAAQLHDVLRSEQKRALIAESVFSFSLLVFFGLMAFLLLRQTNALLGRARNYFREHPGFLTGIRLGQVDLLSRASTRGAVAIGMSIAHRFLQVAIVYAWLVFSLSLFDSTRPYTGKLTGFVVQPISALLERLGGALPVLVVAGIAAIAVAMLVRFVGLFFEAVARGETKLEWLPADFAPASSILLRGGIVVAALALGSPLVTGSDDGPLPRVGLVTILILGVSAVPLLASAVVGAVVVFARSVRVGDYVEWGGHVGRVKATSLLTLHLEDEAGCDLFVPHLLSLVHPTRVLGHAPLQTIDVVVDPHASQAHAHGVLISAVMAFRGRVALVRIDGTGAHYRITASDPDENSKNLVLALSGALEQHGIALANTSSIHASGRTSEEA